MKLPSNKLSKSLARPLKKIGRYRVLLFIVAIAGVYGYVVFEINTFTSLQPNSETITSQLSNIRPPKIDQAVVKQLQALQDNSVSVKSLFERARNNPFEE